MGITGSRSGVTLEKGLCHTFNILTISCSSKRDSCVLSAAPEIDAAFSAARSSRAMVVNIAMPPCSASLASLVVVWGAASRQSA